MPLTSGTRIGPYEIQGALGAGGMGEVYRAVDTALGRSAAVKVLPDLFARDADRLARFEREARTLASLSHPNIAQVFGLERAGADGSMALVMELVEGPTLADRIESGPIADDEAWPIARQIAEALEAAHDQGIVHRDLKPANVKVRADGTVKVLDFGLAKSGAASPAVSTGAQRPVESPTITSPAMTQAGLIMGTAAYMSPEQARGRAVDRRADIWAFGCVLFEMITGRRTFPGDDVSDLLVAIIRDEPDWRALPASTPERVRTLLRRCLQKDPQKRLPHIGLARLELAEIADAPEPGGSPRAPRPRFVERLSWAAGGAAIVGLVAVAFRATPAPEPERPTIRFQIGPPPGAVMPGSNGAPRFTVSRDGRAVVYQVLDEGGQNALWIRRIDEAVGRPIRGTETGMSNGLVQPFLSPDGRSVAFFDEPARQLKRVDLEAGAASVLATVAGNQTGGSWSPGGAIVFSTMLTAGVQSIPATGGTPTAATVVDRSKRESSHLFPEFLPDGRRFLYLARYDDDLPSAVFVGSLDGAAPVRVLESPYAVKFAPPDRLLYVRGDALVSQRLDLVTLALLGEPVTVVSPILRTGAGRVAFAAADDGTLVYATGTPGSNAEGVWLDRSGRPLDIPPLPMREISVQLSPDGRTLAFFAGAVSTIGDDLWLYDVDRRVPTRLNTMAGGGPVSFSPDGARIVFRGRDGNLQVQPASGATPPAPIVRGAPTDLLSAHDWASNGNRLVVAKSVGSGRGLLILPVGGDQTPEMYLDNLQSPVHAQVSPDGRWLAYSTGNDSSRQVYVQSFPDPSLGRWPVSRPGGGIPRWRRDGKELYFIDDAGWVSAVSIVARGTGLDIGSASQLFQGVPSATQGGYPYDVSPDGQRFVMMRPPRSGPSAALTVEIHP